MNLLEARDVSVRFGSFTAVDKVSVNVGPGERVGLIGPNGAGKSSLFAALSGFEDAGGGTIRFNGRDVTGYGPVRRARAGLGRTFQVPKEFAHLSVRENLMTAAPSQAGESLLSLLFAASRVARQEKEIGAEADSHLEFLNIAHVANESAVRLSGGQKKLLELGRVLMTGPKLILLDEPFAGVNPVLIGEISDRIRELSGQGISVLIVEHNLNALSQLVDRLYVMDRGRIMAEGKPDEVLASDIVREAYMGGVA
ncbi:MAG: ABC transporter ATP-binding protein [Rhodobiaceae bacterium]|nr:ABC transporter ATP-binding protein [Rhodobiaceae bacterium]MCC0049893.1 ABC transporter ATP-binding protein [Rhodobiaceae bacterium]